MSQTPKTDELKSESTSETKIINNMIKLKHNNSEITVAHHSANGLIRIHVHTKKHHNGEDEYQYFTMLEESIASFFASMADAHNDGFEQGVSSQVIKTTQ
jgi:hypothetical protein